MQQIKANCKQTQVNTYSVSFILPFHPGSTRAVVLQFVYFGNAGLWEHRINVTRSWPGFFAVSFKFVPLPQVNGIFK